MTVGDWLAARTPAAPDALRSRITALLHDSLSRDAAQAGAVCLAAAERLVATLLASDSSTRESALDLLTADALVTYAFEAAAETPGTLAAHAADAMSRIASLGATASGWPAA